MPDLSSAELDRSFLFGQRAMELMKAYRSSATPRGYAVWYTYVAGLNPQLNESVKRITAEHGALTDNNVDILFETYLDNRQLSTETERASTGVLAEIEQIMEITRYMRPNITAGDGTTSLTATLFVRRSHR